MKLEKLEIYITGMRVRVLHGTSKIGDHRYKNKKKLKIIEKELKRYINQYDLNFHIDSKTTYNQLSSETSIKKVAKKSRSSFQSIREIVKTSTNSVTWSFGINTSTFTPKFANKPITPPINANKLFNKRQQEVYGKQADFIDRKQILKRDDWVCYLCGDRIKGSAHIDHILPIGIGPQGKNNLAATHPKCNIAKSNKLPDQLDYFTRTRLEQKWFELNHIHWQNVYIEPIP